MTSIRKPGLLGPQENTHEERLLRAREIAEVFQSRFNPLAIGLYGSLARGTDGPYSDIEMLCVVQERGVDQDYEWSEGPWKAEVGVASADLVLAHAARLEDDWPLTHGAFIDILPLHDPTHYFPRLKQLVFEHREEAYLRLIHGHIVGEIYEYVGKMRNARQSGHRDHVSSIAVGMVHHGALIIGLANRRLFTSAQTYVRESLDLPGNPLGYTRLCSLVMRGHLDNLGEVADAADEVLEGI